MPNHTTNNVLIETNTNEEQEILALQILKNDLGIKDGQFDFNGIIPMPKESKKGAEISIEDFVDGDEPEGYENVMGKYVPKDLKIRKIKLSVKAAQIDEEKSLIAKFGEGATKSGATLKGIFEKAIGKKEKK